MSNSLPKTDRTVERKLANVLLVDDQPGKLLTYRTILEDVGANLVTASSAREALEHLLKNEFAAIIVDVCMPELDGFELAEMIRDHPRFRSTAIIFVSGVHVSDLDRLKGYERGAVDYLPVPIVPEMLRAKVRVFVELHLKTKELELLNRGLEHRVAERTAELEQAARRKDEFLAVLAHELRNPLAAIRMAAQSLTMPGPTIDRDKWAGVIDRQVSHLSRLIDDLVDVSRMTRGTIDLQRAPVDLASVVSEAIEASRPILDDRRHTITVNLTGRLPVFGDTDRLVQVLSNLLNNAAKFTPKGGQITVTGTRESNEVVLKVADNGIGISRESLPLIFEMFSQVGRPLDRPSVGLGIGLALARALVDLHGGSLTAHSDGPGTGTELTVRLPFHAGTPVAASPPLIDASTTSLAPSRILVVDDNIDAADALAFMLRAAGHDVATAHDGLEALDISSSFRPRVVLLDLGMPKLNGYDAASKIREQTWAKDVLLVALTGWGQPKDRDRTTQAGFNAHLVKPVGMEELFGTLAQLGISNGAMRQWGNE
jgi:signal transduction histidine kinase